MSAVMGDDLCGGTAADKACQSNVPPTPNRGTSVGANSERSPSEPERTFCRLPGCAHTAVGSLLIASSMSEATLGESGNDEHGPVPAPSTETTGRRRSARWSDLYAGLAFAAFAFAMNRDFLRTHFSTDGYYGYFLTSFRDSLRAASQMGRPVTGVVTLLLTEVLGLHPVRDQLLLTPIAVLFLTAAAYRLYTIARLGPGRSDLLLKASVLLLVFPPLQVEIFCFVELALTYSIAVFFLIEAVRLIAQDDGRGRAVLAALSLAVTAFTYQPVVVLFPALVYALLASGEQATWPRLWRRATRAAVVFLVVSGANVFYVRFGHTALFGEAPTPRASPDLATMSKNLEIVLGNIWRVYSRMYEMFPPGTYLAAIALGLVALAALGSRTAALLGALAIVLVTVTTFAIDLIQPDPRWLPPRICIPASGALGLVLLMAGRWSPRRAWAGALATATALVALVADFAVYTRIATDHAVLVRLDQEYARVIVERIEQAEATLGVRVARVAYFEDGSLVQTYPGIFTAGDINVRALGTSWSIVPLLRYVSGRPFQEVPPDRAVVEQNFAGLRWDSFRPEEQVKVIGDTAYVAIY